MYHSSAGFDITITSSRGRVYARLTHQQTLDLVPVSENRFAYTKVKAELAFAVAEAGPASAVTLYQNGMEIRCERVE